MFLRKQKRDLVKSFFIFFLNGRIKGKQKIENKGELFNVVQIRLSILFMKFRFSEKKIKVLGRLDGWVVRSDYYDLGQDIEMLCWK